jgi:hypothetical protein
MDPSGPSATSTTAAAPWKGTAVFDTVRVSPDSFRSVMFRAAAPRREFTRDRMPDAARPQRTNGDNIPLWSVKLVVEDWRGRDHIITVSVPMYDDPSTKFARGDFIVLPGLTFGVTPKREGGFVTWLSADGIEPVSVKPAAA